MHVDLSGIVIKTSVNQEEYYVMFTDDYIGDCITYSIPDQGAETVLNASRKNSEELRGRLIEGGRTP